VIPEAGHMVHRDQAEAVNEVVIEFLRTLNLKTR
jgi:pimeloyl-ACP methyl ester carboxylesterase